MDEDDGRSCYRLDDGKVRQSFLMFFTCPGLHTAEEKDHDDYNDDNRYVPGRSILVKSHHMVRKNNTPGTAGGTGGRDRMLAIKRRKTPQNLFFLS